jgi:hypothetical protein
MAVLKEPTTQNTHEFSDILHSRRFGDGSPMLETLHKRGFLRKVPVDNVTLYPLPNHPLPLADANREIDALSSDAPPSNPAPEADSSSTPATPVNEEVPVGSEDNSVVAANLLVQAELLEKDAEAMREKAYTLDPELRPTKGRPKLSDEEKNRRKDISNKKRREDYQEKKEKALKKKAELKNNPTTKE